VGDIPYAFRTFRRAPLTALTIVVTVGLGLGLVTTLFTILNLVLFRVDDVRNPGELFGVERPRMANGDRVRLTRPQFDAIRRETDVFAASFAMLPDIDTRIDGRMMSATLVTGNFFEVLGVAAARGRALTVDDDANAEPAVVVSHRGWMRIFAGDPGAMGRRLLVNGVAFQIVGIMPEGFRGLDVGAPDLWAPLSTLAQFRPIHRGHEDAVGLDIVGRLKPGMSRRKALAGLIVWDSGANASPASDRSARITLEPRNGTIPQPTEALIVFTPLFFACGLILLIGCSNVANLLLARGLSRQREIGIRLSIGASRWRIVRQLLTESLLLALAAAAVGFFVSRIALSATVYAVSSTLAPELAETVRLIVPDADWRVALFLVGGAAASTVFFGLAPALQATRLELVRTMHGEIARMARPSRLRGALVGVQVTASTLLLICAAVFLRSALASSAADPGFRTTDTVVVEVLNEQMRAKMIDAVRAEPSVSAFAASWPDVLHRPQAAIAGGDRDKATVRYRFVSPDYFSVLGIDVLRGRAFSQAERNANAAVVVIAESLARELWAGGDAVGRIMRLEPDPDADSKRDGDLPLPVRAATVVGIARDVAGYRLSDFKEANVYVPVGVAEAGTTLTVRVHGNPDMARLALVRTLTAVDPNMGQVITMRTLARLETYFLQVAFWSTLVLGALALVLTLSGLFSVLSYLVEQRTKEIGVRVALGATARDVGALVVSQTLRSVAIGLAAGAALAAGAGIVLMATAAAERIGPIVRLFDPVAYAASVACILAACLAAAAIPAARAVRVNPIAALRQD